MKVHVEPKPLHEPLAGGTPGRTGRGRADDRRPRHLAAADDGAPGRPLRDAEAAARAARAASRRSTVPCPAFLIRHPSAGAILVDTGLHPSIATDGRRTSAASAPASASPALEPGDDVPAQLRERGLDPGEIPIVVMTHLHIDHTSAISEFPNSTFVAQRGRVGGGDDRPAAAAERLPPRPLRLRLRLPHGRLRPRRDRLLRELRPHLRPLRRRLDPARLHARPQRRPHVGDRPPRRARLRDRRRRRLHAGASSRATRRCAPRPFDAHN